MRRIGASINGSIRVSFQICFCEEGVCWMNKKCADGGNVDWIGDPLDESDMWRV